MVQRHYLSVDDKGFSAIEASGKTMKIANMNRVQAKLG
jgi:hypothetical protein